MKKAGKKISESSIDYYPYQVFPTDLNARNTAFGGRVLEIADRVAGVVAQRHSGKICVTLLVDSVHFCAPARRGEVLIFKAAVNRTWNTSMEVGVKVYAENYQTKTRRHVVSAYFTFVAINKLHKPSPVPKIIPETEDEKRRYKDADNRRKTRLKNKTS